MSTAANDTSYTDKQAAVAEKVRKLLVKAEDPGATLEEAEALTEKAQQLMSNWSITVAMISDASPDRTEKIVSRDITVRGGTFGNRRISLVSSIGRQNDCRSVYHKAWKRYGSNDPVTYVVNVTGYETDVTWVETLFASLNTQLDNALLHSLKHDKPAHIHGRQWSPSFIGGFTSEINRRLSRARKAAIKEQQERVDVERRELIQANLDNEVPETHSVALVLASKVEKVEKEYKLRNPNLRSVKQASLTSNAAYGQGQAAGARANLAKGSVGGSRRSLGA